MELEAHSQGAVRKNNELTVLVDTCKYNIIIMIPPILNISSASKLANGMQEQTFDNHCE